MATSQSQSSRGYDTQNPNQVGPDPDGLENIDNMINELAEIEKADANEYGVNPQSTNSNEYQSNEYETNQISIVGSQNETVVNTVDQPTIIVNQSDHTPTTIDKSNELDDVPIVSVKTKPKIGNVAKRVKTLSSIQQWMKPTAIDTEQRGDDEMAQQIEDLHNDFAPWSFNECCKYTAFLFVFTVQAIWSRGGGQMSFFASEGISRSLTMSKFVPTHTGAVGDKVFDEIIRIGEIYDYLDQVALPLVFDYRFPNDTQITDTSLPLRVIQNQYVCTVQ